jgi:hypothetical protein
MGAVAGAGEVTASAGAATPYLVGADGLLSGVAAAHAIPGGAFVGLSLGIASGIVTGVGVYIIYEVTTYTPPSDYYTDVEGQCGIFDMNNGC